MEDKSKLEPYTLLSVTDTEPHPVNPSIRYFVARYWNGKREVTSLEWASDELGATVLALKRMDTNKRALVTNRALKGKDNGQSNT